MRRLNHKRNLRQQDARRENRRDGDDDFVHCIFSYLLSMRFKSRNGKGSPLVVVALPSVICVEE